MTLTDAGKLLGLAPATPKEDDMREPAADEDRERLDRLEKFAVWAGLYTDDEHLRAVAAEALGLRAGVSPSTGDDRLREAAQAYLDGWDRTEEESWAMRQGQRRDALRAALSTGAPDTEEPS